MLRDLIKQEIEKAAKKLYGKKVDFDIFSDGKFGDYSSNAAMILAKDLKNNPMAIANNLKSQISNLKSGFFEKIEAIPPGFLNFYLSEKGLIKGIKSIFDCPKPGLGQKIQVEFISANPTGELHIGHGRSAFYGDVLANVLEKAGYKVEREYFINDSKESTQIKELGKTVLGKGKNYLTDDLKLKIKKLKFKIKDESEAGYAIAEEIQKDNEKFIKSLGIKFDRWFSEERELRQKTEFKKVLELLKKKKLVYEKDGALWLKTSQYGDDEDRVILRSDGSVPYFLSDIAYHIDKFGRKYNKVIDIWGADHHGHVKRMMSAKEMLGWKGKLEILISQLVTLKEGGEKRKLSKRKGTIILLKDLIKEVGLDACRWFYLEKSLSTHMDFDLEMAKERSQKNPVYYAQYACARMSSILSKSKIKNQKSIRQPADKNQKILKLEPVRNLIKKLIQFPEIIEDTVNDYQVQRLTTYAYELAGEFSQFYRDVKVLGSENEKELVALVALTKKVLADTLKLLGISAPERM